MVFAPETLSSNNAPASRMLVPPRYFLFASNMTDHSRQYIVTEKEIDQAIQRYGTNIMLMVDIGGHIKPNADAHRLLNYARDKKIQHIAVYTEGRTGKTHGTYEAGELARRHELARQYSVSDSQWMGGEWQKHFYDQIRYNHKTYGATIFEADNIENGETIKFLQNFQAAKNRGELPSNVSWILKNPTIGEVRDLRKALADGSIKRESVAHFAISEFFDSSTWPALRNELSEFGIQLGTAGKHYAVNQEYSPELLTALGRYMPRSDKENTVDARINYPSAIPERNSQLPPTIIPTYTVSNASVQTTNALWRLNI